ncbi:TadE/TadG family type IV pilus assembly protein [Singulisphaera acidiphila]|uniref:TadE-like protein n=1 Tax=Singulisphaera acidiphila (strain ATCC BAA-1392 / DSM 18658 / VKM B-2454 / MOB10) TaxID=886293 RepID=L0DQ69_SINAD|nr:TadE/TadG family type IV pilus assembly protein [Singulisphaera acidiphila]AGA31524.1 TadE-like protein [Singulisphaera acidiphila DSM 18658]
MVKRSPRPTQRRGAALVEAAIIIPLFLMILLGIFEYSRFILVRNLADHAAREGVRQAIVHTYDKTTADIQTLVRSKLAGQDGQLSDGNPSIQVLKANPTNDVRTAVWTTDWNNARFGDWVMVQIKGTYRPVVPSILLMNNTIQVEAQAMMRCEAN